jgi:hypothetical protein
VLGPVSFAADLPQITSLAGRRHTAPRPKRGGYVCNRNNPAPHTENGFEVTVAAARHNSRRWAGGPVGRWAALRPTGVGAVTMA